MATNIDSDNFNDYFEEALMSHSTSEETADEVYAQDIDAETTTLPIAQHNASTGAASYKKVKVGSLIQAVADEVETEGMMQAVTQAQFDAIFGDSSSD